MSRRVWRMALVAVVLAVIAHGCGNVRSATLVDEAAGTWSCATPTATATDGPLPFEVTIDRAGRFTWVVPSYGPEEMRGRWHLNDGDLEITFDRQPGDLVAAEVLVKGVNPDAGRVAVEGSLNPDRRPFSLEVTRRGTNRVSLRANRPGADTWHCTKR
jgi:hypothetical protein